MTNLKKAVDYFINKEKCTGQRSSPENLMRALIFLRQCEDEGLTLTGIGYVNFDGSPYGLNNAYEGGFSATKNDGH